MHLLTVGDRLIILGISFQVFTMSIFGILAGIFVIRFRKSRKDRPASNTSDGPENEKEDDPWIFCYAVGVAYLTILIRCVYR